MINKNNSFNESLKELFIVFGLLILANGCSSFFMTLCDLVIIEKYNFSFLKKIRNLQKIKTFDPIFVILIGPFLEELMFRLPLVINRKNFIIAVSIAIFYFFGIKISKVSLQNFNEWYFKILAIIIFLILNKFIIHRKILHYLENNLFIQYYYFSIILFGMLHIINFNSLIPENLIVFAPIFVLPQIILGFFVSYLRINNGFYWGLLFHCLYNSLSFLIY